MDYLSPAQPPTYIGMIPPYFNPYIPYIVHLHVGHPLIYTAWAKKTERFDTFQQPLILQPQVIYHFDGHYLPFQGISLNVVSVRVIFNEHSKAPTHSNKTATNGTSLFLYCSM